MSLKTITNIKEVVEEKYYICCYTDLNLRKSFIVLHSKGTYNYSKISLDFKDIEDIPPLDTWMVLPNIKYRIRMWLDIRKRMVFECNSIDKDILTRIAYMYELCGNK